LLKDYTNPQDILGEHGLLKQLTKHLVERVLEAELDLQEGRCDETSFALSGIVNVSV
jgi:hypothetical protein